MRPEQSDAIIAGPSAMYGRISALLKPVPAAKDERATAIRRAAAVAQDSNSPTCHLFQ
jgi:hypothetical protein